MRNKILLVAVACLVGAGLLELLVYQYRTSSQLPQEVPGVCTADALLCPDGSSVGRSGPTCAFLPCPSQGSFSGELVEQDGVFMVVLPAPEDVPGEALYTLPLERVDTSVARALVGRQVLVTGVFKEGNVFHVATLERAPDQASDEQGAALGTFAVGDTKMLGGVRLTVEEVVQDSRCPIDVQCFAAGSVQVRVALTSDAEHASAVLSSGASPLTFDVFQISIVDVAPARGVVAHPIDPAAFRITFRVEPLQAPSSIEQYLREHVSELSPAKPVLGGTFYVTAVRVTGDTTAVVEYEDGHIALTADVVYSLSGQGDVKVESFIVRKQ